MFKPVKMPEKEVEEALKKFPDWKNVGRTSIYRELETKTFPLAIGVVNAIAVLAEKFNHHPEILIHKGKIVKIILYTWAANGVTELDFKLAREIDNLGF
jgi:4a-hydroxytetrahydrobiopterin dehydratase